MFNLEIVKNLPAVETSQLELMLVVITNKELKESITNELMKRKDLNTFKVIKKGGSTNKKIKTHFEGKAILRYMVENNIDVCEYLDSFKIIEQYGKAFPKELFNIEIVEEQIKESSYLKKV